ncbi:MAG: hypothetical protein FWF86_08820 [Clostridia bacterium]|nr:hypothetical protein [Clostridia bacterium]
MQQGILIMAVFFVIVGFIVLRKLPAMLALPLVAFIIPLIAGVPILEVSNVIIARGSYSMAGALIANIFGVMLGMVMKKCNITQTIIRKAAELGGDKPVLISIAMYTAVAIIFLGAGQFGTYIMIATIALPVMMTVGVPGVVAQSTLALASHTGSIWSVSNWVYFRSLLGVGLEQCIVPAAITTVVYACVGSAFITIQARRVSPAQWAAMAEAKENQPQTENAPWCSLITPILPIMLVFFFKMEAIAAMIFAMIYACVTTNWKNIIENLTESMLEGLVEGRPSFVMNFGIAMLVTAVRYEAVALAVQPIINSVLPTTMLGYIAFFSLLAPLQLYRGPMSIWGMGAGLGALMSASGILTPIQVACALVILDRFMAADPTLTYNVWGSAYVGCDVNDIMKKLIPYTWIVVLLSITGTALYLF